MDEEHLAGGVANAGAVTRVGAHVLRPSNPHSESVHRFLSALQGAGFEGAPRPVGIDEDGRERLEFIDGDVGLPPYPAWVQANHCLTSVSFLMRRLHAASRGFAPSDGTWSEDLADPDSGQVVCHNDVCLENVVFRRGVAVALLDFDFAAPGRPVWDLARFAVMCVPVDDTVNASRLGWVPADRPARLRLVADAYGLASQERKELLLILDLLVAQGGQWVLSKVEAGDANFTKMWTDLGGMERYDRRRRWWAKKRNRFAAALD